MINTNIGNSTRIVEFINYLKTTEVFVNHRTNTSRVRKYREYGCFTLRYNDDIQLEQLTFDEAIELANDDSVLVLPANEFIDKYALYEPDNENLVHLLADMRYIIIKKDSAIMQLLTTPYVVDTITSSRIVFHIGYDNLVSSIEYIKQNIENIAYVLISDTPLIIELKELWISGNNRLDICYSEIVPNGIVNEPVAIIRFNNADSEFLNILKSQTSDNISILVEGGISTVEMRLLSITNEDMETINYLIDVYKLLDMGNVIPSLKYDISYGRIENVFTLNELLRPK